VKKKYPQNRGFYSGKNFSLLSMGRMLGTQKEFKKYVSKSG
jgi:hypothetical protein